MRAEVVNYFVWVDRSKFIVDAYCLISFIVSVMMMMMDLISETFIQ